MALGCTMMSMSETKKYYQQWETCYAMVGEHFSRIVIDLGYLRMLPMPKKGNTLLVQIVLPSHKGFSKNWLSSVISFFRGSRSEDGLPSDDEAAVLEKIGNALNVSLNAKIDVSYVGFIAGRQRCTFCFCTGEASTQEQIVHETMRQFPEHECEGSNVLVDDNWDIYTGMLFPSHQFYKQIQDSEVVTRFEKGGDPLTNPRSVDHWCYFRNESDRARFIEKVRQEGFQVDDCHDDGSGEFTFCVKLSRVDLVDRENLFKYTSHLWNLAYEHYGEYDGWGAMEMEG
jgi:hypothetical protein